MIGVEPIVEIAHALETVVRNADRAGGVLVSASVAATRQGVDAIAERVRAVAEGRTPEKAPPTLLEAIGSTQVPAASVAPVHATDWDAKLGVGERAQLAQALAQSHVWAVTFFPSDEHVARGITIATVRAQLATLGELIKVIPRTFARDAAPAGIAFEILIASDADAGALAAAGETTLAALREVPRPQAVPVAEALPVEVAAAVSDEAVADAPAIARAIVRVDLARLDTLQEQMSGLIVSRFRLQRELAIQRERGVDIRALHEVIELLGRQLRDMRRAILQVRLVRATEVLEPLALLVRSLARTNGKDVALELDAGTAELDKSVADRLLPALVHLVRNAVDHAIESPGERAAAGKPATGRIQITCREIAGNLLDLAITDDGRGIDRRAVARKADRALERDEDLLDAIMVPGFSTRQAVTETSGRGLGMDIVRRIVTGDLRGELSLVTTEGTGTTFTLRVPVTIAVVDVFSFACGAQTFVVPVSSVEEIFEIDPAQLVAPPRRDEHPYALVERRGRAVPLIPLGPMLAIAGSEAKKALVVCRSGAPLAFGVDRMLGRQEVVVRPIDDPLLQLPGIAGATDLGDGFPTIVLDLLALGGMTREEMA
jgi:two-component system chemotaxis sensor kinase CheA